MSRSIRIAAILAFVLAAHPSARGGEQKFAILPPVAVVSVKQLHDMIRLDSGNVVLVNAWATWCKPCLEELPAIAELSREYGEKPFRVILLSADDSVLMATTVKDELTKAGITLQTYLVAGSGDEYFINSMSLKWSGALPTTFLYDRKGILKEMLTGKQSYLKFSTSVDKLLRSK